MVHKMCPSVRIGDKKCALGVGTMQNRVEGQYTISPPHFAAPPLPGIHLTGA